MNTPCQQLPRTWTHCATRTWSPLLLACLLTACAAPSAPGFGYKTPDLPAQPEVGSGITPKPGWAFRRQAVAAANPLATDAGAQVLRAGGSAVDAAVAVQAVLTLVEPQASGIGGGAFLLHFDGKRVQAFDGRETAPAGANERLFLQPDGKPMAFQAAVVGGRAVGVPGTLRALELAHKQHGKLPWASLFQPAIELAQNGFAVSPRLNTQLAADKDLLKDPVAAAYFYRPDGTPHPVGHLLKNPELAAVLRQVANLGARALYEGPVAAAVVKTVQQHPTNPGSLSQADLTAYQAKERYPLCHEHAVQQRTLRLCGFPPPSSGALAVGQILGLLARTPSGAVPLNDVPLADWLHHYAEASRLTFADRALYVADPDFVTAPGGKWTSLLAPGYLDERAKLISATRMQDAPAGQPGPTNSAWAPMPDQPEYGTSHISIVDGAGRAVAMTTTIEAGFGSRMMVTTGANGLGGFLLNNELTDFSFAPADALGKPIANRVEPGKRPRSSMSPTLVFDAANDQLLMSAGSPGGSSIIHYTAKTLLGVFNGGLTPQAAIDLPNFANTGGPLLLEQQRFPPATVEALKQKGHTVNETEMTSGLQAIVRGQVHGETFWFGGADPRREGVVMGD